MNTAQTIGEVLLATTVISLIFYACAGGALEAWMSEEPVTGEEALPPVTFFRPLKAGVPELSAKLSFLARALRPGDQLLIGVEPGSVEGETAEALRQAHPGLDIVVVACEPGGALNPKIAKLLRMEPHARHEDWILSDSEAITDAQFLIAFRREWMQCDVLTAGYRFSRAETWPQRLDAAGVLLGLWPGLALLRSEWRVNLTLGACTGFRRADLEAVGGWKAFADELAEDNRLGRALAAAGRCIRLSRVLVTLESDPLSWREYWRHQRRVAVTYRVANPLGFAGAIVTHGVTIGWLLACWRGTDVGTWMLWGVVFAVRCLTARDAARLLGFEIGSLVPVVFVASLVETACWGLSWLTRRVWWSGRYRRISWRGRLC